MDIRRSGMTPEVTLRIVNGIFHRYVIYGTFFNSLEVTGRIEAVGA